MFKDTNTVGNVTNINRQAKSCINHVRPISEVSNMWHLGSQKIIWNAENVHKDKLLYSLADSIFLYSNPTETSTFIPCF